MCKPPVGLANDTSRSCRSIERNICVPNALNTIFDLGIDRQKRGAGPIERNDVPALCSAVTCDWPTTPDPSAPLWPFRRLCGPAAGVHDALVIANATYDDPARRARMAVREQRSAGKREPFRGQMAGHFGLEDGRGGAGSRPPRRRSAAPVEWHDRTLKTSSSATRRPAEPVGPSVGGPVRIDGAAARRQGAGVGRGGVQVAVDLSTAASSRSGLTFFPYSGLHGVPASRSERSSGLWSGLLSRYVVAR